MVRVRVNVNKLIQLMSMKESNKEILISFLIDFLADKFEHLGLNWSTASILGASEDVNVLSAIAGGDEAGETSYSVYMHENVSSRPIYFIVNFRVQLRVVPLQLRRFQMFALKSLCSVLTDRPQRICTPNETANFSSIITIAVNTETLFANQPDEFVTYVSEQRYGKECVFNTIFIELDKYKAELTHPTFANNVEKWIHFLKFSHLLSKDEVLKIYNSHQSILKLYNDFFNELCEVITDLDVQQKKIESEERKLKN